MGMITNDWMGAIKEEFRKEMAIKAIPTPGGTGALSNAVSISSISL